MSEKALSTGAAGMVTGLFPNRGSAERAFRSATALGYQPDQINVLMSDATREAHFSGAAANDTALAGKASDSTGPTQAADNLGGPPGGTLGTLAPALAAVGTLLLIPGLGMVAAGPVAAALTAAGAVGVTGGLIGALANWGVPHGRVQAYEAGIREGGILLAVKPPTEDAADHLLRQWRADGGQKVEK